MICKGTFFGDGSLGSFGDPASSVGRQEMHGGLKLSFQRNQRGVLK